MNYRNIDQIPTSHTLWNSISKSTCIQVVIAKGNKRWMKSAHLCIDRLVIVNEYKIGVNRDQPIMAIIQKFKMTATEISFAQNSVLHPYIFMIFV
jgi:hypothetical protein